jgi:hypothetical protein
MVTARRYNDFAVGGKNEFVYSRFITGWLRHNGFRDSGRAVLILPRLHD